MSIRDVVIIGAGFGGLSAAKELAGAPVNVTLVDQQNHHLFQPLLYQVATAALTPAEIAVPIRSVLRRQRNARVLMDRVIDVDADAATVVTESGRTLPFDALVIATGARHSYFGKDDWATHAPGLKTLNDALGLREKILMAFEQAEMVVENDPEAARRFQTFVVVGAGPTGVELAGAIAELSQSVMRDFRHIDGANNRIILLEGGPRVLPSFAEDLSLRAMHDLKALGVEVRTETMVTDIAAGHVTTNQGDIPTETVIWAAGVQASPAGAWLGLANGRSGHVEVDETLRPKGFDNIYVIGDTARHEADGGALPGIAPVAKQMGQYVGRRLSKLASGKEPPSGFRYLDAGSLATIGRNRAVADIFGLKVKGFAGWLLWGAAHVYFLIGFKNRLFVMLHWLWLYLTWQRGVRLIMHHEPATDSEKS
ncbi:NAD(P)/FAD-dependent oxidoreductase [Hoeflea prorocentri]|uniref:NADH:ubiquinone reductase (non-electrogenic) n=1 Tax=Hoeflea prorocentri TaxID=1922333 RepID=A0A9X3UK62_9HYPH|nr:NAD(P)/FAD-dependent oxidoreductase [Hoeflea prorocentri]MCY6382076.1 NAD(P)/FAD-dependent oxidoreductase [Hoeflea prorocentri]MDA5399876.1 NAD(P)/FAD-dependent oxidoreductase [Hoeflea prorocentri]